MYRLPRRLENRGCLAGRETFGVGVSGRPVTTRKGSRVPDVDFQPLYGRRESRGVTPPSLDTVECPYSPPARVHGSEVPVEAVVQERPVYDEGLPGPPPPPQPRPSLKTKKKKNYL